jgi:hypothetical protein
MTETLSMIVALADAIAAGLQAAQDANPGVFAMPFTTEVKFIEITDLDTILPLPDAMPKAAKTANPRVIFFPQGPDVETRMGGGANARFHGEYIVDMVIYARVGTGPAAEAICRRLLDLRQQLRDTLKPARLAVQGIRPTYVTLEKIGDDTEGTYGPLPLTQDGLFCSSQSLKWSVPT